MAAKFNRFSDRVNELLAKQGSKSLNRWMDNQEVCQQLNISPRTLQTLRDNGIIAYYQLDGKILHKESADAAMETKVEAISRQPPLHMPPLTYPANQVRQQIKK